MVMSTIEVPTVAIGLVLLVLTPIVFISTVNIGKWKAINVHTATLFAVSRNRGLFAALRVTGEKRSE